MLLNNDTIAIEQLLKDKHTLLEGYVTEHLFYTQFLKENTVPKSNGWWMSTINNRRFFFIVKEDLSEFDRELISLIPKTNQCWQVRTNSEDFDFTRNDETLTKQQFVEKFELKMIRKPMVAKNYTRDKDRQNKAIKFFVKNRLLTKIATERTFANNFLSVYFYGMINVDYFTKTNEQYNVIEIKFKYESQDGFFGINKGQMEMFQFFASLKFNIYHFILYNHTKDMNISIFGFLEKNEEKNWLHKKINPSKRYSISLAPEMTSVSGGFSQPYYKLPFSEIEKHKIILTTNE